MAVLTVSQINRYMASKVREDRNLQRFMIRGEISNFVAHRSGHYYFSLRDQDCVIKAVMFRTSASRLRFLPENGMSVIVSAGLTVYERDGVYQLTVTDMQPDGIGTQQLQLEQRKSKLREQGLFDESAKRQLPAMPRTIGVITSGTGAALQDILQILQRRCPIVSVLVFPVLVQGERAAASISKAFYAAEQEACDVIILGRGGGAAEDLQAFNTEEVAYAIYNCSIPVISAVGHETDITIADAVADRRAPTPSAAAELSVPDISHLHEKNRIAARTLQTAYESRLQRETHRLERLTAQLRLLSPEARIAAQEHKRIALTQRLENRMQQRLERSYLTLTAQDEKLRQLDPMRVLKRGYAAVCGNNGEILSSVQKVIIGEAVRIRMQDGSFTAKVEQIDDI